MASCSFRVKNNRSYERSDLMSFTKRYFEELISMGYSKEDIKTFRESLPRSKKDEDT